MREFIKIFLIVLHVLLQSCSGPKPKKEDFVGFWKADDGAIVRLKEDNTCIVEKISYDKIYDFEEYKNKRLSFSGNWDLISVDKKLQIDVIYNENETYVYKGKTYTRKGGFSFDIAGAKGFFEDRPPWYLFFWIGDPDNGEKYIFRKQ